MTVSSSRSVPDVCSTDTLFDARRSLLCEVEYTTDLVASIVPQDHRQAILPLRAGTIAVRPVRVVIVSLAKWPDATHPFDKEMA